MVVVCSLFEGEETLHRKANEVEEKEEEDDLKNVKEKAKEVEKDTEVEGETAVEKLYRTTGQDNEEEEEMFRIIQEMKEELHRHLQEKKLKLLRRSTISAVSTNDTHLGKSDPKEQKRFQGAKTVTAPLISNSRLRAADSLRKHRTQDKQKKFQDKFGAIYWTGPHINGLFLTIFFALFMTLSGGQNHERPAYCHISVDPITQECKLSCQFQVDLRERKQSFEVLHIKRDGSPDLVVDGTWIEDEHKAYTADGYVLDGPVSDQFVIRMQNHVVHSGQIYACTLPLTPAENLKTCQVPKTYLTAMLNTPPDVHNGAWRPVYQEKMLLITAAITYGIIYRYV